MILTAHDKISKNPRNYPTNEYIFILWLGSIPRCLSWQFLQRRSWSWWISKISILQWYSRWSSVLPKWYLFNNKWWSFKKVIHNDAWLPCSLSTSWNRYCNGSTCHGYCRERWQLWFYLSPCSGKFSYHIITWEK